ncbi:MAG: GIY-YIG nuclease family protein [Candidatus Absconditabacterales bacterium]
MTKNIDNRLKQHNDGAAKSTKAHRPYKIIYIERLNSYKEAYHRERYFKTGKGRDELKEIINQSNGLVDMPA